MIRLYKIIIAIAVFSLFVGCGDRKVETNKVNEMDNEVIQTIDSELSDEEKAVIKEPDVTVKPTIKIDLENNKVLVYAVINNSTGNKLSTISFDLNYIDAEENIISSEPIQLEVNEVSEILIGECVVRDYYGVRAENIQYNFEESN